MLNKVHASKSLSYIENKKCDVQCLICKRYSNAILYVCESGHFVCKSCKSMDKARTIQENTKREHLLHRQPKLLTMISKERELASGDNEKIDQNKESNQGNHKPNTQHQDSKCDLKIKNNDDFFKTTIKYKNKNFKGSTSSIETTSMNIINYKDEKTNESKTDSLVRPVTCPVATCGKMLAIDSIMLHFCFDHSKVAKILLKPRKSQRIIQKSYVFTNHTQCIAVVDHEQHSKSAQHTSHSYDDFHSDSDQKNLLLLCAMVSLNSSTTANKTITSINKTRNVLSKGNKVFENDDILLLWLCKTGSYADTYKVTLSREDKLLSHSFIGEPIHVRDSQNASSVYDMSNCLIVRGIAANRLLDKQNQFHIFISVV